MRWGLIFAVLVLAGCAAEKYSDRYYSAERPPPDVRRISPVVYADEDCPPPQVIAAYCGSMRGRDACLAEPQCAWVGGDCRGIACRIPVPRRRYYSRDYRDYREYREY
ncbi:MAG TPA: hypothetical protein VFR00_00395 [Hyphomicrobiaceae bacterium]|jgi:hypothetical protein|nr:hypothetical protein [Hyphomicrobiaceae bacterium]